MTELVLVEEGTRITIGGLGGTGKTSAAILLAAELGYSSMSAGEYFREFAIKEGVPNSVIEERAVSDSKYDKMVDERTSAYGLENNHFVFEGRLAYKSIKGVHILLKCKTKVRVQRIANRHGIDFKKALIETRHREMAARERYRKHNKVVNFTNTENYDLVVDTTGVEKKEVVNAIITFLKRKGMYHPLRKH